MKLFFTFLISLLITQGAFAVGTVTQSKSFKRFQSGKVVQIVTIDWTADAAAATVPDTTVSGLNGHLMKVITNPGATAPTDNYDIELLDGLDSTLDAAAALLLNRDTATTEQVYPVVSGTTLPVFLAGDYTFKLSNNSVNSATGRVILILAESL